MKIYDRVKNLKHTLTKAIYHHGMVSEKNKITVIKKNPEQAQHTCVWGKVRKGEKEVTLITEPISEFLSEALVGILYSP